MSASSRREFVARAAALASFARGVFGKDALTHANLGVQLYTVRNIIEKDPASVLKSIADIGYTEVEATSGNLDKIWPALQGTGLKPVSVHVETGIWNTGGDALTQLLSGLKQKGFQYAVYPYVPPNQRGGLDVFKKLADTLNRSGKAAQAQGLKFCYHNHAFEFEPMGGTTGLETFMNETSKETVGLELDIFWVVTAGHDPIELLQKYKGRIPLLHLKDRMKGSSAQFNEKVPPATFKEVGSGSIDIPAVLKTANTVGVKHYFVEQDQTPGDPIASLRKSYEYLSKQFKT